MLGAIKRSFNRIQNRGPRSAMHWKDCDAERQSNRHESLALELEMEMFGFFVNQFGALACRLPAGIGQDQNEFIAAITTGDILSADLSEQQVALFTTLQNSWSVVQGMIWWE